MTRFKPDSPWWLALRFCIHPAIVALFLSFSLIGCDLPTTSSPTYTGTVAETRGQCWTMLGDDKKRYAVSREVGEKLKWKAGDKVTVEGEVASKQDCAAAIKLEVKVASE